MAWRSEHSCKQGLSSWPFSRSDIGPGIASSALYITQVLSRHTCPHPPFPRIPESPRRLRWRLQSAGDADEATLSSMRAESMSSRRNLSLASEIDELKTLLSPARGPRSPSHSLPHTNVPRMSLTGVASRGPGSPPSPGDAEALGAFISPPGLRLHHYQPQQKPAERA